MANGVLSRGIGPPGITAAGPPATENVPVQFVVRVTVYVPECRYMWFNDAIGYAPPGSVLVRVVPSPKSQVHEASTLSVTCTPSNVSLNACATGVLVENRVGRLTTPLPAGCWLGFAVVSS